MDFFVYVDDQSELEAEVLSVEAAEITEIDEFNISGHETLLTGTMRVTAEMTISVIVS